MLQSMTERQFQEWRAYAELEPFGPLELYWAAACIRHTTAAAAGNKGLDVKHFYPDFAGDFKPPEQTDAQIDTVLRGWVSKTKKA